jgi:hypothetical protein
MAKPNIRGFDDWYAIEEIAPGLFGIGEPKYQWLNWYYLIVGRDRALLFDIGPGIRDITPVVMSLTDKPITALLSHLHFDHSVKGFRSACAFCAARRASLVADRPSYRSGRD